MENYFYCPNCGKKIKNPPLSKTFGKQLSIYLISIFLPPLGIIPSIRYIFSNDKITKLIGFIALILTTISTVITLMYAAFLYNTLMLQISTLQNIGY